MASDTVDDVDTAKVERVALAIMKEAGLINNPIIQNELTTRYALSMMYARRYARAAIRAMDVSEPEEPTETLSRSGFR